MKKILLVAITATLFIACSDDDAKKDDIACTLEVRPALSLLIKDAVTQATLTEGITVTAVTTPGNHTEQLQTYGGTEFTGLMGYGGTTTVTFEKEGYQDKVSVFFTETSPCGVVTTRDTINLQQLY